MADFLPDYVGELRTIIASTWSLSNDNIFSVDNVDQTNILDLLAGVIEKEAGGNITGDIVVLIYGRLTLDPEWGIQNRLYRDPVEVWRISKMQDRSSTNQHVLNGYVYDLKEAINNASPNYYRQIESPNIDSSGLNELNVEALDAQYKFLGAALKWAPGLLVGDTA